uniref:Uncharacterized protein n=1 Tax=Strongyloides venezuelensis TaxID=75913 RepID=A0A0K0EWD5_STRVS
MITLYAIYNKCQIGFLYYCSHNTNYCSISKNAEDLIYIRLVSSNEYENFVLKLIPKSNTNKDIFNIIDCPELTWSPKFSNAEYFPTRENFFINTTYHDNSKDYWLNFTIAKIQEFIPSIDVGYQCDEYYDNSINHFVNKHGESYFLYIKNTELMCQNHIIYQSPPAGIALLTRGNNYNDVNEFRIRHLIKDTNLYAGDKLHILDSEKRVKRCWYHMEDCLVYIVNYEAKCKLPNIKATLRLKINDTVQKFRQKI